MRVAFGNEDVISKVIFLINEESEMVIQPALKALWSLCLNNGLLFKQYFSF